jgi:membrane-bound lytic murein transglycosylase B
MRVRAAIAAITAGAIAIASALAAYLLKTAPPAPPMPPIAAISQPPQAPAAPAPPPGATPEFRAFLESLWPDAGAKGISRATFDRAMAGVGPDLEVLDLNANQPEHTRSAGEYLGLLVSETRLVNGREKLAQHGDLLAAIEGATGVDRHIVLAIWGIESAYGFNMGMRSVIRSLATLAANDQQRAPFWRGELIAALGILERGDTTPDALVGSWAGAMGHTQFMPSTFQAHAVDFDKDGRRDIWATLGDALASTANYLKVSGWTSGLPWGFEVRLPTPFDFALADPAKSKPLADWSALGVVPNAPRTGDSDLGPVSLILPAGAEGPAFLVTRNFRAILRYNNAVPYALAVGHLADRFRGDSAFAKPWPTGDRGLTRAEREDLQRLLAARGHDAGVADGILGSQSRAAIRAYQTTVGLAADGHPNAALLERLRREAKP